MDRFHCASLERGGIYRDVGIDRFFFPHWNGGIITIYYRFTRLFTRLVDRCFFIKIPGLYIIIINFDFEGKRNSKIFFIIFFVSFVFILFLRYINRLRLLRPEILKKRRRRGRENVTKVTHRDHDLRKHGLGMPDISNFAGFQEKGNDSTNRAAFNPTFRRCKHSSEAYH